MPRRCTKLDLAGVSDVLQPRQTKLLACLLSQPSIAEACKQASIPESTAFLWLRDPTFAGAYREARRQALAMATSQLCAASAEAVQRLRDVMNDAQATPAARVSAARCILEIAIRAVEVDDLAARLSAVEELLAGAASHGLTNGAKKVRTP